MFEMLKGAKVVLFGAGKNGRKMLELLISHGITPAYFVDNNTDTKFVERADKSEGSVFFVNLPEVLLSEEKSKLKIIITPNHDFYTKIETQIKEMGLEECILHNSVGSCRHLQGRLVFQSNFITFCCDPDNYFLKTNPRLTYLDTAEETIENFLKTKENIIRELTDCSIVEYKHAKPCKNCEALGTGLLFHDNKLTSINISCYPSACQARCIFCGVHKNYTYKETKESRYPKMIAEMIDYLRDKNLIAANCHFFVAPGEITINPYKDLLLKAISAYRATFATNAFRFEPMIADSLKKNGGSINVSLDSGTKETFKLIKGLDMFEKVIGNLMNYRQHGAVDIKYVIIPGVNDDDKDIDGCINILKSLNLRTLTLSFEHGLPLSAAFYSTARFVDKLKSNGLSFNFIAYGANWVKNSINEYFIPEYESELTQKNNHLREVFYNEHINDYNKYRRYVYITEVVELIEKFKECTRFALLGVAKDDKYIVSAFEKLNIPLQTPNSSYNESYDAVKDAADIFIIRNKEQFNDVKAYIESNSGDGKRLLDIEKYYFSFEPAKLFLERNIANEYLK